jgi:glycosyltransferase involved in cell wall biosynthesis
VSEHRPDNFLMVANFPSDTGYAWRTIHEYFLALGQLFLAFGSVSTICYPKVDAFPEAVAGAGIRVEEFDFFGSGLSSLYRFLRSRNIGTVYLTDRPVFSHRYLVCRLAGVKRIVLHDRTSGARSIPGAVKGSLKRIMTGSRLCSVDLGIAISDFVKRRLNEVCCLPGERTVRVHNGIDIERFRPAPDGYVNELFGIAPDRKIVFASSRANRYKGIQTLIEAAEIIAAEPKFDDVLFLYCGDGPDLDFFRTLVMEKGLEERFLCPGASADIHRIVRGVDIAVVPSIWQEGFGLSVLEGMAAGKPVVATRVGGIVEIIEDGRTGFLFQPEDARGLARILAGLLQDDRLREKTGRNARAAVVEKWNIEDKKAELVSVFRERVLGEERPRAVASHCR